MAKLPTEQDIGDLPDRLPRRMGVGGWQPNDLERGAQAIAQGGERLGVDLGRFAGEQTMLQNQAQTAKANSQANVGYVQNAQAITNSNDPDQVASLRQNYPVIAQGAAQNIDDPDARAKFLIDHAPEVTRYQVGADQHQQGLVKNQAIADFDNTTTTSINAAVSTDDETARNNLLTGIKQNAQSLVARGIWTPEEWAQKAPQVAHDYATARVEAEIARAKATGDTSRLQDLSKLFTFNPGEWNVAPPAGAPGAIAPVPPTTNPAPVGGFANAVSRTLGFEGSALVTDVNGAPVKWGINKAANPDADVANMTAPQAAAIYKAKYWDPIGGDALAQKNPALAHVAFDTAVVAGPEKAKALIAQSGGDPQKFMDLRDQYLNGLLQSDPGKYGRAANAWSQRDAGLRADISRPPVAAATPGVQSQTGAPARAVGDSLARGVGGVTGVMNAATSANPQQVLSILRGQDVTTTHLENGKPVKETAPGLSDADVKGPIVLSTGASNDPNSASLVTAQLAALKARGTDLSNVTVLGVGNRPDFQKIDVNGTLQKAALAAGAKFQPLDAGMIGPDGVHPVAEGYKALASQIGGGAPPAQAGASPFIGVPPPGAVGANPHLAPPQSEWPTDARGVEHNPDGSLSYIMSEGNRVPVPGSRASGAAGAPAPSGTGTILDALKPQERGELGVRLQNEIDSIERSKQAQDNQYAKAAVSDITARVQSMTEGRPIGPNEEASLKPYATSPNPAVRQAYAQMMTIRDNLASYQGKSPAQVQADVEAKEAAYNSLREKYPDSPAIETMGLILNAAEKYSKTYSEEAAKAPIERAIKSGLLPSGTPALDPNDPNIEATLARRVSDAKTAATQLGVPTRFLQQSERPALKEIARQGGEPMVDMAMHIVKAAGADAPQIFREIGVDAPMFQKIGELAASGGDPEAVRDIASVISAKRDKAASADLPVFTDKMLSKYADPIEGAASRFGADFTGRTRAAANMLMTAQAQRDGWDPKTDPYNPNLNQQFFDRAYNLATGATYAPDGTRYGGVVERNAKNWFGEKNNVIAPNTIKADDFGSVVNSISDADLKGLASPPMGRNGAPITAAQISAGHLEALPDKDGMFRGKYAVFTDGMRDPDHLVRDSAGKPWALDLSDPKLDAALRARNPNSYLGKTAAPMPQPNRYQSTPGMVALSGEAEAE